MVGVGICGSFAQDFTIWLQKKNIIEMAVMPPEVLPTAVPEISVPEIPPAHLIGEEITRPGDAKRLHYRPKASWTHSWN